MDDSLTPMETAGNAPGIAPATEMESPSGSIEPRSPTRFKRIARTIGWLWLGTFCLFLFTLIKLPEDKIQSYVQGMISSQLASQGITLTAQKSHISIGFGISYNMQDVTLAFQPPQESVRIEQISVSP